MPSPRYGLTYAHISSRCHVLDMVLHMLTYRADAMSQTWSYTLSQINAFVPDEVLHEFHFTHLVPTDRSRTHSARLKEFAHTQCL